MNTNGIRIFLIFCSYVQCRRFENDTTDLFILLNTTSHINSLPKCASGRKIDLVSYSYQRRECANDKTCYTNFTEPFTPGQVYNIHKGCSLRESCRNISSLFDTKEVSNETNTVHMGYRCLDKDTTFVDLCTQEKAKFTSTIHLIYTHNSTSFKECRCFLKKGRFTIVLSDVRLTTAGEKCSSAQLLMNKVKYTCDEMLNTFGSVFMYKAQTNLSIAYISLTKLRYSDDPQMIWITIQPAAPVYMTCENTPWSFATTTPYVRTKDFTVQVSELTNFKEGNTTKPVKEAQGEEKTAAQLILIASVCSVGALVVTMTSIFFVLRKICASQRPKCEEHSTNGHEHTTEAAIPLPECSTFQNERREEVLCSQCRHIASMQDLRECDANVDYILPIPDSTNDEYCEINEIAEFILPTITEYEQLETETRSNETDYAAEVGNGIEVEEQPQLCCNDGDYLHPTYCQE